MPSDGRRLDASGSDLTRRSLRPRLLERVQRAVDEGGAYNRRNPRALPLCDQQRGRDARESHSAGDADPEQHGVLPEALDEELPLPRTQSFPREPSHVPIASKA